MLQKIHVNRLNLTKTALLIITFLSTFGYTNAQFTRGNVVVTQAQGNTSVGTAIKLLEYSPTGTAGTTVTLPSTTSGARICQSGSATSEGFPSLSAELDRLIVVGYDAALATTGIAATSSAVVPRVISSVDKSGTFTYNFAQSVFSANNIRGGTAFGTNFIASGSNTGIIQMNTPTTISSSPIVNNRQIQVFNGNMYFTTGSGTSRGLYQLTGLSIATSQTATNVVNQAGTGNPFGFSISPDGNTCYIADGTAGILKYTRTGGTGSFSSAYTVFATACSGLCVDFTTTNPTIYATTSDGLNLIKLTDAGSTVTSSVSSLAIATTTSTLPFRGVAFVPSVFASVSGSASICTGSSANVTFRGNPYGTITYKINSGSNVTTTLDSTGTSIISSGTLTSNDTFTLVNIITPSGTTTQTGSAIINVISAPASITGSTTACIATTTTLTDATPGGTWSSSNTSVATIGSTTGNVIGVTSGTSIISYTISCGTATTIITVNPSPNTITGTASFCQGATTTLTETSTGGTWSSSNTAVATVGSTGIVNGVLAGTATISYTFGSGCYAIAGVTVNPTAVTGTITGTTGLSISGTTTLSDAVSGGIWSSSNTSIATVGSTGIVTGVASGTATISYTVTGACGTGSATIVVTVFNTNFTPGNLAVLVIGDGTGAPGSAASPISILEYSTTGVSSGTNIALPSTGSPQITVSGSATSEGQMTLSAERDRIAIAGYDAAAGTASVNSTTSATVNREIFTVNSNGVYSKVASTSTAYSGNNIRSASASGTNYFSAGPTSGMELLNTSTQLTSSPTNTRVVQIFNGQTYFTSSSSPFIGVSTLGTGIPTTSGQTSTLITPTITSAYGFSISPDGNTMYVADDGASATGGITKYTLSSGSFASTYVVNSKACRGITVDYSGTNPIIYATTSAGDSVIKITDAGAGSAYTAIIGVPTNKIFRSISFAPSCNATIASVGSSTICRGTSTSIVIIGNPTATVSYNINGGSTLTTTIGANGYDTISTGTLTSNATYNLVNISTTACSSVPLSGSITINVIPKLISGLTTVCEGSTSTLSDTTTGGTWISSSTSVATIGSTSGLLTGVAAGTTTITYTASACQVTATASVNITPVTITGTTSVCVGSTTPLTETTTGGSWVSSNANTTVGSTGIITGVSAGTSIISYVLPSGCYNSTIVTINPLPASITGITNICTGANVTLSNTTGGGTWSSSNSNVTIGSSTGSVTGVSQGTSIISYTLPTGCFAITPITVSNAPSLTGTTNNGPICAGTTLTLGVTGASNVTGYLWNGPVSITSSTSASASVPSATTAANGTYTVTVNNGTGTGCTASYTTAATVSPAPSLTGATNNGPICAGTTLTLGVTGASNVTGYLWNGPVSITSSTSASASVPSATTAANGTYTVTVNNGTGTGCTASYTTAATVSPAPSLTGATNNGPICAGTTLTLGVTGASNVTGYLWNGPVSITSSTSASASVPSATTAANGTYTVTVNNGSGTGCTASYTSAATVSPAPSLTGATNNSPICAGTTLTLGVTGPSNVTGYLWNGPVSITSSTSASASVPSATTAANGTYTVTVNNGTGTGCTASYTTASTVSPAPSLTSANNNGPICAGATLTLGVTGASNVTGYLWNGPVSITSSTSASASVPSATTAANGTYTVTVNNGTGTGCTASYTTAATVSPAPSLTSANNNGPICAGTTLTLGVTGASNVTGYLWNGPVSIISSTSASASVPSATTAANGTYTVTVNNGTGTGCTASYTTAATVSPAPSLTGATNNGPICAGTTLTLGVTGASNVTGYLWNGPVSITSSTSASASVPSATTAANGTYTVTVNNGSGTGCTASYTSAATVSPAPSLTGATNNGPICAGTTLTLGVTGASNVTGYLWNGPVSITSSTSASASVPSATTAANGTYTVTVNNGTGIGCVNRYTTTAIVSNAPTTVTVSGGGTFCNSTTISASGGTGGTIYFQGTTSGGTSTTTASTSQTITTSGTYYFRAMSAGGCWGPEGSVTVNIPTISGPSSLCRGLTNTYTATGGSGTWASSNTTVATIGSTSGILNALASGNTTISYTLTTGCVVTKMLTVSLTLPAISGPAMVCVGQSITLTNGISGGTWTSSAPTIATVGAGTGMVNGIAGNLRATITYTIASGCLATTIVSVNPLAPITSRSTYACVGQSITMSDVVLGGTWSPSVSGIVTAGVSSGLITGLSSGSLTISYILPTGCTTTTSLVVNALAPITGASTVCVGQTTTLSNSLSGGSWYSVTPSIASINLSTGVVTGVGAGGVPATISYLMPSGCNTTRSMSVNALAPITTARTFDVCMGQSITVADGVAGGTWSTNSTSIATAVATSAVITGVNAGNTSISYSLTNGCIATHTVNVNPRAAITGPASVCVGQTITLGNINAGGVWTSLAPSVAAIGSISGIVTGAGGGVSTTIAYTLGSGCVSTTTITSNALPVVSAITGPSSVSVTGSPITLADVTAGGRWSSNNIGIALVGSTTGVVSGVSTGVGIISYTVTNSNGCVRSVTKNITVGPAPVAQNIQTTDNLNLSVGENATINGIKEGGVWCSNDNNIVAVDAETGIASGISIGRATISYTVANLNETFLYLTNVTVTNNSGTLSTPSIDNNVSVKLIPNPNNGTFNIAGSVTFESNEVVTIEISNMMGQVVSKTVVPVSNGSINATINLDNTLANGIYIATVITPAGNQVLHFVIAK